MNRRDTKTIAAILTGTVAVIALTAFVLLMQAERNRQKTLVCHPEERTCDEYPIADVKVVGDCLSIAGQHDCRPFKNFDMQDVREEAIRGCTRVGGYLGSPKTGFYTCTVGAQQHTWWPVSREWETVK
jgi:hypothetical protein